MTRGRRGETPFKATIRTLKPGEPIPESEPHRYLARGYVRLRWLVGTGQMVEALEHRVVMERHLGRPLSSEEQVHHINHQRGDNRVENLEVMSLLEHAKRHAIERRVDASLIVNLYSEGNSTVEVGHLVGLNPGQISRRLAKAGIKARGYGQPKTPVDIPRLKEPHRAGVSQRAIARMLGVSANVVRRVFLDERLVANPPGRQPKQTVAP